MLISIGKSYKTYFFILGSALFKLLSLILTGDGNKYKDFGLFGFCPTFNKFNFTQSILIYFGYIIFGIIFYFFKKIKKAEQGSIKIKTVPQPEHSFIIIQIKFMQKIYAKILL